MIAIKKILVATDFSEASDAALAYGRTLASHFGAALQVVHVVENIVLRNVTADGFAGNLPEVQVEVEAKARKQLDDELSGEPQASGLVLTSNVLADAIVSHAATAGVDLIVIGTHGRKGVSRLLLGSVAERVVRAAPCPVLTVHHPEREFVHPEPTRTVVTA
jgi:nucleotide-binding universal stress UspA family protein